MFGDTADAAYEATAPIECIPEAVSDVVTLVTDTGGSISTVLIRLPKQRREDLHDAALKTAMERAREKAERIAVAEDMTVGQLREVASKEISGGFSRPAQMGRESATSIPRVLILVTTNPVDLFHHQIDRINNPYTARFQLSRYEMSRLAEKLEGATAPVFITHRRADRDSLGAALGLYAILGVGTICTPAGITKPARGLRKVTDATICEGELPGEFDEAVVLDAPSTDRISPIDPDSMLLIDHHEPADLASKAEASLVSTDAGATAELVAQLATTSGWDIPSDAALPLLVGLLDDTGFPRAGSPKTAVTAATLFDAVEDQVTALPELLDQSIGRDERIASATSVLRSRGYRAGDVFVAFSKVGAHEGTAAAQLRSAGVDLVIVSSTQGGEIRVTARASERMAERVSLGATLLPTLADEFGGDGGGHDVAGSATVAAGEIDSIVDEVLAILESELGLTFSEVSG